MLNCKQVSQLVSQSLDRRLTWKERMAVRMHLIICKYCKRFEQQLHAMRKAIKRMATEVEQDDTIQMPSDVKARIADKINSAQ